MSSDSRPPCNVCLPSTSCEIAPEPRGTQQICPGLSLVHPGLSPLATQVCHQSNQVCLGAPLFLRLFLHPFFKKSKTLRRGIKSFIFFHQSVVLRPPKAFGGLINKERSLDKFSPIWIQSAMLLLLIANTIIFLRFPT